MTCHWCETDCGGTCLGLTTSTQMRTDDPAYFLLRDGKTSTPVVYDPHCYICRDPEFAAMGLPLCRPCDDCRDAGRGEGHVPADDEECSECGWNAREAWEALIAESEAKKK